MKKELSVQNQIVKAIEEKGVGHLFFPSDYYEIGSQTAVNAAFSRLAATGMLMHIGKGIYLYPKPDPELGYLHPSLEKIAAIIAEREKVIIRPTGAYALNKLGLSTQVETNTVFFTDGNPRKFNVSGVTIKFIRVAPKKLAAKGKYSYLAVQALEALGERGVDNNVLNRLYEVLRQENIITLKEDAKLSSIWISKILYTIIKKIESHG